MPNPPGFRGDTPFAKLLRSRGIIASDLGVLQNIAKRLANAPGQVAPNSPMLPPLAEFLNLPLKKLQKFAEGNEMAAGFVHKVKVQLERAGRGDGKRDETPPVEEHATTSNGDTPTVPRAFAKNATPINRLFAEHNTSPKLISDATGIHLSLLWRLSGGDVAPNHPVVAIVANHIGLPTEALAGMMKLPPMDGKYIERSAQVLAEQMSGKRNGAKPAKQKKGRKPGTAVVRQNAQEIETRTYNRLGSKRAELGLRQSARAMVATLNVSIMRGDTHMPPLPVGDLYLVLQDYLQEKGVKENVLVSPNFARLFDPK
jgi:hypothetical protein